MVNLLRSLALSAVVLIAALMPSFADCTGQPSANRICASPNGVSGVMSPRAMVDADVPSVLAGKSLTGGTHTAITSLGIRSTGAAFDLSLAVTEVLTAGRTLTFKVNDVSRTIDVASIMFPPQGRCTLVTATPVMTTTQSAKTAIFYTPAVGNVIPIYDGTSMVPTVFSELTVATTDTTKSPAAIGASKLNDWFVWNDAGTIRVSHGPDWTNDTTRSAGTALVGVKGISLNNASITNGPAASRGTYVCTTRSNGSSQLDWIYGASASGGTAAFLGLWNAYNRVSIGTTVTDSGANYTYTTATTRQERASAGNQVSFVIGIQEDAVAFNYFSTTVTVAVGGVTQIGVGFNVTNAFSVAAAVFSPGVNGAAVSQQSVGQWSAPIGFNTLSANERGDGTNANIFNNNSNNYMSAQVRM